MLNQKPSKHKQARAAQEASAILRRERMKEPSSPLRRMLIAAFMLAVSGQACTLSLFNPPALPGAVTSTPGPVLPTSTPHPVAQTTFITVIPEPLQPGETLTI